MEPSPFKPEATPESLALSPRGAARALGISPRTLWAYTQSKRIPHLRLGRRVIYPVDALRDWLKQSMISQTNAVSG